MVVAGGLQQEAMTENCCGCQEDCSNCGSVLEIRQSK